MISCVIGTVLLGGLLVTCSLKSPPAGKRSEVPMYQDVYGNSGMNANNRVDRVTFQLDSHSTSIIRSSTNTIPTTPDKGVAVPAASADN